VRDKLDFAFEDLGEQHVKNIARPVRVYRVRGPAVPIEQPLPTSPQPLPRPDKPDDDETFVFGSFRRIPAQQMLLDDGKPLRLDSRALDILITLVESAGETISKDQLIARTWPDTVVDEGALRVHVAALRKALGDGRAGKRYVANNPGRGYAFVAPVTRENARPDPASGDVAAERNNLPAALTRIIGRDDVVAALTTQLVRRRFLTIVGPGGIGKTTVFGSPP
jgi:DNA-binding winged helix-turn-helix (wHTH) protein